MIKEGLQWRCRAVEVLTWSQSSVCFFQLLGSLISDFVDSFRPTARINSICGKSIHSSSSHSVVSIISHKPLGRSVSCLTSVSVCVCVSGRCSLLPVVNNSGAICNSWKLDPSTLRFPLRGMLPYDKVLLTPLTASLQCRSLHSSATVMIAE